MSRSRLFVMIAICLWLLPDALGLSGAILCAQEQSQGNERPKPISQSELVSVPVPNMEQLESAVREQLQEEQKKVDLAVTTRSASRQECARAYMDLGELYHAYQLSDAAEASYRNGLKLDPSRVEWSYNLGYLLQSVGRYSEAIECYEKARTAHPESYLLFVRVAECHMSLNQLEEAKKNLNAALGINGEEPAVLALMGEVALQEKRYEDAIRYLSSAIEKQPAANSLNYQLGMAYRGLGDMVKARQYLAQRGTVGIQPPDPLRTRLDKLVTGYRVHILAGRRAYSAGRFAEASAAFRKAVDADPENAGARINLAAALGGQEKYPEAMKQLEAAVRLSPDNMAAQFNLGVLCTRSGDHACAVKHFQMVVEKQPKDCEAHLNLADGLLQSHRYSEAFEHYKVAARLEPTLTAAWLQMSTLLSLASQHAEALRILEEAHRRVPANIPIRHALARQLASSPELKLRNGARALELAQQIFGERADYEHARTVAMAYAELNQCDAAVQWQERALSLAREGGATTGIMEILSRNLAYFKNQRPCRVPEN